MENHNNLDYNFNHFKKYGNTTRNNNIIINCVIMFPNGSITHVEDFFINNSEMCFIPFRDCSHFKRIFSFNKKSESEEVFIIENY